MIKKIFLCNIIIIFLLSCLNKTFAWYSIEGSTAGSSTHYKVTKIAVNRIKNIQIDADKCPDIARFGDKIIDWTTWPGNDSNAHGKKYNPDAGAYNGGPYEWWWDGRPIHPNDGMLVQYSVHNFANGDYTAYYYLAIMAHLIADQAVPAHAANISHGFPNHDELERWSNDYFEPQDGAPAIIKTDLNVLNRLKRYYYFEDTTAVPKAIEGSIPLTQGKITSWKSPNDRYYWLENHSKKYIGAQFDSIWGAYGGETANDIFNGSKDTDDIIPTQYAQAIGYMIGFLQSVSRSLPPLITNYTLSNNTINSLQETKITFHVDENRKPAIKIKLTVDGKPIKTGNKTWDGNSEDWLTDNSSDDQLPYQSNFEVGWNGLLSDDTYPSDGSHSIKVEIEDKDGNLSDSYAINFFIDRNGPRVENVYPVDGSSINNNKPAFSFKATDTGSGVDISSFKIIFLGNTYSPLAYDFLTGKLSYSLTFALSDGQYQWSISGMDMAGNKIEDVGYSFTVDTKKPSPLRDFTATPDDRKMQIGWKYPEDPDVQDAEVYRFDGEPKSLDYEYVKKNGIKVYGSRGVADNNSSNAMKNVSQKVNLSSPAFQKDEDLRKYVEKSERIIKLGKDMKNSGKTINQLAEIANDRNDLEKRAAALLMMGYLKLTDERGSVVFLQVPGLLEILKNIGEDEYCRESSAMALGILGDLTVIPDLREVLKDNSGTIRQLVVAALARLGDKTHSDIALKGLMEGSLREKLCAVGSLTVIGDKRIIPELEKSLSADDIYTREFAQLAIFKLKSSR